MPETKPRPEFLKELGARIHDLDKEAKGQALWEIVQEERSSIISAKVIWHPRKRRYCEACRSLMIGPQLRMYGSAERGDPPYTIYVCPDPECAGRDLVVNRVLRGCDPDELSGKRERPK